MKSVPMRIFVVGFSIFSILTAVNQVAGLNVLGSVPNCCTYGVDCSGKGRGGEDQLCCIPLPGQATCSQQDPFYCRDTCG